jgi:hypothetical protein
MKHKLSEIINTDCYVQFDMNEQLKEWVKETGIELDSPIMPYHLYVWLSEHNNHMSLSDAHLPEQPVYHHTNISI